MADTVTANYGFIKPEVNASDDTWGGKLNGNWDAIDGFLAAMGNNAVQWPADKTAVKNTDTTKFTHIWFDSEVWVWNGASQAGVLRTLVGTSSLVDPATDTVTINNHGLETGIALVNTGGVVNNIPLNTLIYAVVTGPNTFKLALSYANAVAAVPIVIDLNDSLAVTLWRHNDPAEGIIITKTGNVTGTLGGWTRSNYATREWLWRWFGIVGGLSTSGPDQSEKINAWMAAANAIKPFRTFTGSGLHAIDSRIHVPTHIIGLYGTRSGLQPTSIYRRFPEPDGPNKAGVANDGTDTITSVGHGFNTGDYFVSATAVFGLLTNTLYFAIRVDDDNFKVAEKRTDAFGGVAMNLTGSGAVTVRKPSLRGNLALELYGGDIRYITFQTNAALAGGGSGLSAILPTDVLRTGDLFILDNYIASGAGSNFSLVIDGSANISPDPSGIGSNGQRDVRVKNNIIFGANIASTLLHSPFGLDWDNSMKATITGGVGNSKMMYLIGSPNNRGYYCKLINDTPWGDVMLDYVEWSSITGTKGGFLKNSVNVKTFNWVGEDSSGITEQLWVDKSGFSFDRRPDFSLVGVKTTGSAELATGHISLASGTHSSKMAGTGTNDHELFYNNALVTPTVVGRIQSAASGTSFLTTSDATLKEDHGEIDAEKALEVMRLMVFHEFTWLEGRKKDWGVFAQELYEIYPVAVIPASTDSEGNYIPWMVDMVKLLPVIGRSVQITLDRQDSIEARLSALEKGVAN